jgi:two-component system CitB family sensor kinase
VVLAPSSHLEHPKVDDTPLLTVMSNLIDNAIDAICDDDSTLGRQPRGVVTVTLTEDAGDLRLTVEDTGPGIPSHLTEKVFVDGYSTKPPRGLMHRGIGLALVHRLITRAGGRIAVHGEAGATFDVRLPIPVGQAVR